jgi:hypothetical protein
VWVWVWGRGDEVCHGSGVRENADVDVDFERRREGGWVVGC